MGEAWGKADSRVEGNQKENKQKQKQNKTNTTPRRQNVAEIFLSVGITVY